MSRWKGKGRHSVPGYNWRHQRCPYCDTRYRDLRVADLFPDLRSARQLWEHCKEEQKLQREKEEQLGDYSRPVNRRSVLGRMFEYKQMVWQEHLSACEQAEAEREEI